MRLIREPKPRVFEELPGYFTVYGPEGVSIGVMVSTKSEGCFWYFGADDEGIEDAEKGALNELSDTYGEPELVPFREEVPELAVYESAKTTLARETKEQLAYETFITEASILEADVIKKK